MYDGRTMTIQSLAHLLGAAGEPARLRILHMLTEGVRCECQLVNVLGRSQSTVSRHLAVLRAAGLVVGERRGRWVIWRLGEINPRAKPVLKLVLGMTGKDPAMLRDRRKVRAQKVDNLPKVCRPGARA